jgi:hypothetical protein
MLRCIAMQTKTSSCFHESLIWPVEFIEKIIPSLLKKSGHLWAFLFETIPCEYFFFNGISLIVRSTVYVTGWQLGTGDKKPHVAVYYKNL